jgi:hypothetical protein
LGPEHIGRWIDYHEGTGKIETGKIQVLERSDSGALALGGCSLIGRGPSSRNGNPLSLS